MNSWHLFHFAKTAFPLSCRTPYLSYQPPLDLFSTRPFPSGPTHLPPRKAGTLAMLQRSQCSPNGAEAGRLPVSQLQKAILEYMIWLVSNLCLPGLLLEDPWCQYSTLSVLMANGSDAIKDCFIAKDIIFSFSLSSFDMILLNRCNLIKRKPLLLRCLLGTLWLEVTHYNIFNKLFSQHSVF